jgi:hypothetical protein
MEFIIIAILILAGVWGAYAYWIFKTAKRYGKKGDGRH